MAIVLAAAQTPHTDTLSYISLGASLLAVGVSGLSYRHTVKRDTRLERRSIVVTVWEGYASQPLLGWGGSPTTSILRVTAVNDAHRTVEVVSVSFRAASGQGMFVMPLPNVGASLPARLADGESAVLYFDEAAMDANLAKHSYTLTEVVVADAHGSEYTAAYPK